VRFAPRAGDPEILATAVAELVAISAAQELVFRGWLLRALKRLGFWPAAILAGGAFVAVHLARPGETAAGLSGLFVFALLAAAGVRRAGTVAWAVGLHAGWNLVQDVVLGLPDGGLASRAGWLQAHLVGPAWLTGGGAGPEGGAPALLLMAVALLALGRIARPADRDTAPRRG
jgi:membrane protease YdiL (CAAX protease family)